MGVARSSAPEPTEKCPKDHPGRPPHDHRGSESVDPHLALQRTVGNQVACALLARPAAERPEAPPLRRARTTAAPPAADPGPGPRLGPVQARPLGVQRDLFFPTATEFNGPADRMSDMTLMKIWRLHKQGELYLSTPNMNELTRAMSRRNLDTRGDSWKTNPLDLDRGHMKTTGGAVVETAKPLGVVSAGAAGGVGAGYANAHSSAGGSTTGGNVGGEIVGAALLADASLGLYNAYQAHGTAEKRGDKAGMHLAAGRAKHAGWGVAGGATSVASGGLKIGTAFGSTAVGLAAATGGLGIAGGALTAAQGLWKIVKSGRRLSTLADVKPVTEPGHTWKGYITGREQRKIGVNALKVAAGALGIAAGALLLASNPVGWAIGIAALVTGAAVSGFKLFQKIKKSWKQRSAKAKLEERGDLDDLARPTPGGHAPGSEEEKEARRKQVRALADKVSAESSQGMAHAAAMRGAVQTGDPQRGQFGVLMRDTFHPRDTDFRQSIAAAEQEHEARFKFTMADLRAFDAATLMDTLNVSTEEALSESGQDLLARKMSVSEAS